MTTPYEDKIIGRFTHTIFRSEDGLFSVCRFALSDDTERKLIVTGCLPELDKERTYQLYGQYEEHPRYGMQFKVLKTEVMPLNDRESLIRYFAGPSFPKIGKKLAQRIVDTLGENCMVLLQEDPLRLDEVEKITETQKKTILEGLRNQNTSFQKTAEFFQVLGLTMRQIAKIDVIYGTEAIQKLTENPYRMVFEVDGIGFRTADKLALQLGFPEDSPLRLQSLMVDLANRMVFMNGDTYLEHDTFLDAFYTEIGEAVVDGEALLKTLLDTRLLFREEDRIYPAVQYRSEVGVAKYLYDFPVDPLEPIESTYLEKTLATVQENLGIHYDETQIEALQTFFTSKMMILTGGPGTGKTTVVKGMIQCLKEFYPEAQILLCAPTGRAAKRLSELTDHPAQTIHRSLLWDLETNTFAKNEKEPLLVDVLIVDEFSMVDNFLFFSLLKASQSVKKICLIGDEDQLPSVGPGALLKDLVDSKVYPLIRLEKIFRQKEGSDVIELAGRIRKGEMSLDGLNHDFSFLPCTNYQVKDLVLQIVQSALDKGYTLDDIQVLAPLYDGVAGIDRLNAALQACFNPPDDEAREIKVGYRTFREGDKILQLKNFPDEDVYNGDIGRLVEIIYKEESDTHQTEIIVDYDGKYITYNPDRFDKIAHAYCISVHKAQGSEYPIVIMPLVKGYHVMLQRRLLYTGVTRAKRSLILLGEKQAYNQAVENWSEKLRNTTLVNRLKTYQVK